MMTKIKSGLTVTRLSVATAIVVAFVYGMLVGRYELPPFIQLKAMKTMVAGAEGEPPSALRARQRHENYANRVAIQGNGNAVSDIVMAGDSITDYAEWWEMFPGVTIANRGIAGDTSEGLLGRIDSVIATRAKTALIMIGINDINRGVDVDDVFQNYQVIVDTLIDNGMVPHIQSTLLLGELLAERNDQVVALNQRLQAFAKSRKIEFIDLNQHLAADGRLDDRYTYDAIHLNAEGYRVWRDVIAPVILRRARGDHDQTSGTSVGAGDHVRGKNGAD